MSHPIILAHLNSMQKQLDFIVHQHLSPIEMRTYFLIGELESLSIADTSPSANDTKHREQKTRKDIELQILENVENPIHWIQRGIAWERMEQMDMAMSDFARALACFNNNTLDTDTSIIVDLLERMSTIHPDLTTRLLSRFPILKDKFHTQ